MSVAVLRSEPKFADRLSSFIERIQPHRADTDEEREAIYRLRYDAYLKEGAIAPAFGRRFVDRFDELDNVFVFGVHYEGKLISSIRVNVVSEQYPDSPAMEVFPDVLTPHLKAGKVIIDATRFVVDAAASRHHPELPYATVRLGVLACEYFRADYGLATVRVEHQAFYKKLLLAEVMSQPRMYPSLKQPITLMATDCLEKGARILLRYPAMRSTAAERDRLFGSVIGQAIAARKGGADPATTKAAVGE
jgi:N-acyl-L-homoserine lactone synthetase